MANTGFEPMQLSQVPASNCITSEAEIAAVTASLIAKQVDHESTVGGETAIVVQENGSPAPGGHENGLVSRGLGSASKTGLKKIEGKLTAKERLEQCNATEKQRLTFGKVHSQKSTSLTTDVIKMY
jgi:hypothetical protein